MKRYLLIILFVALSTATFAQQNYQDVVYLKNGSIIRGMIIEQVPNQYLKIQRNDGSVLVYKMIEVEKITKEEPIVKTDIKDKSDKSSMDLPPRVPGQTTSQIGIRGGIGTDINLGLAYGFGVNYLIILPKNSLELGVLFFGGSFEEETNEGMHTYEEKTNLIVFGFMANYLIGYTPRQPGLFFVAGIGLASINVEWEERSDTDTSLGTSLAGGGSMQSVDGSTGGTILNLGIGKSFVSGLDIRAEMPVIIAFSSPGEASSIVPNLIMTLGYRF